MKFHEVLYSHLWEKCRTNIGAEDERIIKINMSDCNCAQLRMAPKPAICQPRLCPRTDNYPRAKSLYQFSIQSMHFWFFMIFLILRCCPRPSPRSDNCTQLFLNSSSGGNEVVHLVCYPQNSQYINFCWNRTMLSFHLFRRPFWAAILNFDSDFFAYIWSTYLNEHSQQFSWNSVQQFLR